MKRIVSTIIIVLAAVIPGVACEICGCGNNNFQIGVLPNFRNGFAGLRYSYASFHSVVAGDHSQFSHDRYQSMELWGGYQFRKLQVMAFVPYYKMEKASDDGRSSTTGIGDLMVLANYKVFSNTRVTEDLTKTIRNELYLGGGVKFATGMNRIDVSDPEFNIGYFNSQPGTGSTDVLATITHNLLWNNNGIVSNAAYRINGKNAQDFRFGDRFYETTSFYHTFTMKGVKINPLAGVNVVVNNVNRYDGDVIEGSNGHVVSAVAGVNVIVGKFGLLANTFVPVFQRMYDGQTQLKTRSMLGVTFSL